MFSILMKPEATSSQAGKVTQLAEFPWMFLPSMLYASRLMHSKSIFFVAIQCRFLQLFVISIEVRSQITLLGAYTLASGTFLLSLILHQSLLYGTYLSLLGHLYSHSSHWNS